MPGEHFHAAKMPHAPRHFLEDDLYAEVERSIVYGCVDVALRDGGKIFLGDRQVVPQPGPWFIGGRLRYGLGLQDSAAFHVLNDVGLEIVPGRFRFITS